MNATMRATAAIVLAIPFLYSPVIAEVTEPGEPGFGIELVPTRLSNPIPGDSIEVIVRVGCPRETRGLVHLSLPPGVSILAGSLDREVHPSNRSNDPRDSNYLISLRISAPGVYPVRAALKVESGDPGVWDEFEGVLELTASRDSICWRNFRPLRWERVERSQRFRYGGMHMVAIDGPQDIIPGRIDHDAEVLSKTTGTCRTCDASMVPRNVWLVVTVGVDGRVRWIEPRWGVGLEVSDALWDAATSAVKRWRFRPASAAGVPVANWLKVSVPVEGRSK